MQKKISFLPFGQVLFGCQYVENVQLHYKDTLEWSTNTNLKDTLIENQPMVPEIELSLSPLTLAGRFCAVASCSFLVLDASLSISDTFSLGLKRKCEKNEED